MYLQDRAFKQDIFPQNVPGEYRTLLPSFSYPLTGIGLLPHLVIGRADKAHKAAFMCIDWQQDGKKLVACTLSGRMTVWDYNSFNFWTVTTLSHPVRTLRWSHSGDFLITIESDNKATIWQTVYAPIDSFPTHKQTVHDICFSPCDRKFATGSDDTNVFIWDLGTRTIERKIPNSGDVKSVDWHPSRSLIAAGCKDNTTNFIDPRDGKILAKLQFHRAAVAHLHWNQNGYYLVSGGRDTLIYVTDIRMMKAFEPFTGHDREVNTVQWHPTIPDLFASAGKSGEIHWWTLGQERPIYSLPRAHTNPVNDLKFHPMGDCMVTAGRDGVMKFWSRNHPGTDIKKSSMQQQQESIITVPKEKKNRNIPGLPKYKQVFGIEGEEEEEQETQFFQDFDEDEDD